MLPTNTLRTLASLTFDKIGSLREDSKGSFFVTEYVDPNTTASPEERAIAFKNLELRYRAPFSTVSKFYHSSCLLGMANARTDPKEESLEERIEDFETLDKMILKFRIDEYETGPLCYSTTT